MARPLRLEFEGAFWHITSRGNEQKDIFREDADRLRFLELLATAVERYKWVLHEYVLMTNHFHLVIETPEKTLSRGMQWLKGQYARWFNRKYRRRGHLFEGRFKGILVDGESYLLTLARYVVLNPVRAGMVATPDQWKWSSFRATAGLEPEPPFLTTSLMLSYFRAGSEAEARQQYARFVMAPIDDEINPWVNLRNQIYLGGDAWIAELQNRIDAAPRSPDHPRVQRHVRRPGMDSIMSAVAEAHGMRREEVCERRGGQARALAAYLGVYEGMHYQRTISEALGLCSRTRVSALVNQCRQQLERDPVLARRAEIARAALQHRPNPEPYVLVRPPSDLVREPAASYAI